MQKDRQLTIGVSILDKSIVSFGDYQKKSYTPYLSLSFLPFVEIGGKITRFVDNENNSHEAIGDRTFSVRVKVYNESEYIPSVLVGLHDLATVYGGEGAVHNNSLYIVCTKNFEVLPKFAIVGTVGYGTDFLNARTHNFVGLFGGIDLKIYSCLELIMEYDGIHSNGGVRVELFNCIYCIGGFLQYKYFSGGAGFKILL